MILNTSPVILAPTPQAYPRLYPACRQHLALPMRPSLGWAASGSWPPPTPTCGPILWPRSLFPADVQDALVSTCNPHGAITNFDLELAGAILGNQDVLVQEVDCQGRTPAGLCDNVPVGVWHRKGSTTTAGSMSYLLHLSSLHQRHF
jgi:hypothetical protein